MGLVIEGTLAAVVLVGMLITYGFFLAIGFSLGRATMLKVAPGVMLM